MRTGKNKRKQNEQMEKIAQVFDLMEFLKGKKTRKYIEMFFNREWDAITIY